MIMIKSFLICLISLSLTFTLNSQLFGASFDCSKAETFIEKAICSNKELSDLDDQLLNAYKKALASDPQQKDLQRQWLKLDRNVCQDTNCLKLSYKKRLNELNSSKGIAIAADDFTGHYTKKNGEVNVQMLSIDKLKIHINTVVGMHPCNIGEDDDAMAVIKGNTATYKDEQGAVIVLTFGKNNLKVKTNDQANGYCGSAAAGSMDGNYMKKSSKPDFPKP
jgi:uncharacterized protein